MAPLCVGGRNGSPRHLPVPVTGPMGTVCIHDVIILREGVSVVSSPNHGTYPSFLSSGTGLPLTEGIRNSGPQKYKTDVPVFILSPFYSIIVDFVNIVLSAPLLVNVSCPI